MSAGKKPNVTPTAPATPDEMAIDDVLTTTGHFMNFANSVAHPGNAPIHFNPETGRPFVDIRKQLERLMSISSRMLGYDLDGKKRMFFNFRHAGASHIAQRDCKHPTCIPVAGIAYRPPTRGTFKGIKVRGRLACGDLLLPRSLPIAAAPRS